MKVRQAHVNYSLRRCGPMSAVVLALSVKGNGVAGVVQAEQRTAA